jgi:serine/threonine protein kinase
MAPQTLRFGKYDLLERVNVGGMAEVWRARLSGVEGFEKILAVKRILPNIAEDEEFIAMFIDEAKIAVQLTHANIAQIHDLGKIDDSYFIAMEYVPGRDFRAVFDRARKRREHVPVALACYCIARVCDALDYAHRKKDPQGRDLHIVHRDVSPQNVLLSYEGEVKLIDFGIAKAASKAQQTQAGILKGKFAYMSPEQVRGAPLDGRSDVFALGTVMYEVLTGERLFSGDSDFSTLENVRNMKILPPSTYNNRVPRELEPVVLRALARDVDLRYQTAGEFGADLQRFLITQEKVFGPSDLADYMHSTFAEELAKEKVKAAELATASASGARRASPSAVRGSTSGPGLRGSISGTGGLPPRASASSQRSSPSDSGGVARNAPTNIRASPSGPDGASRNAPTSIRASPTGEPLPWDGRSDTVSSAGAEQPPALPRRANSTPPVFEQESSQIPREPPTATAVRPILLQQEPIPSEVGRPRRTAPWIVSLVAGVAGAAVVAGVALVVLFLKGPGVGLLVIHAVPTNASIVVDRVPRGSGAAALKLSAGPHQIDVQAGGFAPYRETVVVPAGGQQIVQAQLKRAAGSSPP